MKKFIWVLLCVVILVTGGCSSANSYDQQLNLGYKYLQEENYQKAIIAMHKAIEINPKRPDAYIGLGDVYVTRCDESTVQDTHQALSTGYEKSSSDKIINAYIRLADALVEKDKVDWAIQLLQMGYERLQIEKLLNKSKELGEDYLEAGRSSEVEVISTMFNNQMYYQENYKEQWERFMKQYEGQKVGGYLYGIRFETPVEVLLDGENVVIKEACISTNCIDETALGGLFPGYEHLADGEAANWKYFNTPLHLTGYFTKGSVDEEGIEYRMVSGEKHILFCPNGQYFFSITACEELK